jgi:hypothetical protein
VELAAADNVIVATPDEWLILRGPLVGGDSVEPGVGCGQDRSSIRGQYASALIDGPSSDGAIARI